MGIHDIAGYTFELADGLRRNGYRVTHLIVQNNKIQTRKGKKPDKVIHYNGWVWLQIRLLYHFMRAILNHDIFIFSSAESFLSTGLEYMSVRRPTLFKIYSRFLDWWFLKKLGKTVVVVCHGCDIRHWMETFEYYGRLKMCSPCHECTDRYTNCHRREKVARVRAVERYADHIFTYENVRYMFTRKRNVHELVFPVDLSGYNYGVHDHYSPIILHCPTRMDKKGTWWLREALDRLERAGIEFTYYELHDKGHNIVVSLLERADIVVDQLCTVGHGVVALEGMASGCAVVSGKNDLNVPVVHGTPGNIKDILLALLSFRRWRNWWVCRGLSYVQRHDHVKVAREMMERIK